MAVMNYSPALTLDQINYFLPPLHVSLYVILRMFSLNQFC
jgi:hypothetical protein